MSASLVLQEAINAALGADAQIKALIGDPARIFDDVPRDATFPYLTIGEGTETDWGTSSDDGTEHRVVIHGWSRYAGRREVKQVMQRVRTVLHDAALTLVGYRLINLRCETIEFSRATDGRSYHGLMRLRAVVEAT